MIYSPTGTLVNDDGSPINSALDGAFIDIGNSTNNYSSGGVIGHTVTLKGKLQILDNNNNIVILFDPNG